MKNARLNIGDTVEMRRTTPFGKEIVEETTVVARVGHEVLFSNGQKFHNI